MQKQKANYKPLLFTLFLAIAAAAAVIFFAGGEAQKTLPKIKLSYFKDNNEFASSIEQSLHAEIGKQKYFWIGYEPEKENQYDLTNLLKQEIEKQNGAFDIVLIDQELMLGEEKEKFLGKTHEIPLKENFNEVSELIKANKDKKILVITAAIYSSNFIQNNPHAKIKDLTQIQPIAFSLGYFPALQEDEVNSLFRCDTEDKTGTSPWGCAVLNKARTIRRRIDLAKLKATPAPRLGLMDISGDHDYMVLVGK
ncbi:hypothetical protein [Pseudobdellovibrio sp. HCB154]|uniref:hypothetical protein n=1 Tax=Pseudobdellovibrio sp. HCB154 TaxID=3386277 RepID=UPI00391743D8